MPGPKRYATLKRNTLHSRKSNDKDFSSASALFVLFSVKHVVSVFCKSSQSVFSGRG